MNIEADLRGEDDSQVNLTDDMDGPVLQLSGNCVEAYIKLDHEHLEKLFEQLVKWGYGCNNDEGEQSDD